jgi:hypothetical protein
VTARIAILIEGPTEAAFKRALIQFLTRQLAGRMPRLDFVPEAGRISKGAKLKQKVRILLKSNDAVIALTDVYTGSTPRDFMDAADAKAKMRGWVGAEPAFHPHAAQYEFEAWLLPYWARIQSLSGSGRTVPSENPENVNHNKPPSRHLAETFRIGSRKRSYSKPRDAAAILRDQDLAVAAASCPELQAFLNTILTLSGAPPL